MQLGNKYNHLLKYELKTEQTKCKAVNIHVKNALLEAK